jgi:hypothetical protein
MEPIRKEDRGTETMVFEMTSIQLNTVLQFCLGNAYEHSGKDRYNVYLVKNGRVHGCIGHYDVPLGESTVDSGGTDFDVMRFKEPTWLIEDSFHLLEKGKEPEKGKAKATPKPPPPKAKSLFRVIITDDNGDCFYDSIVRSMPGNEVDVFDKEKVMALRKRIGEYITTTGFEALREKYRYSIQILSGEETLMKDDPYYFKYYKMLEDGNSKDDVIAVIVSDLENDTSIQGKVDIETFRVAGPTDPSENKFSEEEILAPARHFLEDYFGNEKELNETDIKGVFLENIEKPQVWASELIILQTEQMLDVKFLLLEKNGSIVEEYTTKDLNTYKVIGSNTKFIIADYTPLAHFKLIVMDNKKQFSIDEVPAVIKAKFSLFQSKPPSIVVAEQDNELEELETPAVEDVTEPTGEKYTREKLDKMDNTQLKEILKNEFKSIPISNLSNKNDYIECILNPEQEKCKRKNTTKKASIVPKAAESDSEPPTESESEPQPESPTEPPAEPLVPTNINYTREQLVKMKKKDLEEILKKNTSISWTTIGKKGVPEIIDCILNPELEKCQSKKSKKKGGNYTRKQSLQHD